MARGGRLVLMGWYTTRWTPASTAEEAEKLTLEILRSDPALAHSPDGSNARMYFEEVEEIDEGEVPETQGGFTFFEMET